MCKKLLLLTTMMLLGANGSAWAIDHWWHGGVSENANDPNNWTDRDATTAPTTPTGDPRDIVRIGGSWDSEDLNGNGMLDPGEDLNGNGLIDDPDPNSGIGYGGYYGAGGGIELAVNPVLRDTYVSRTGTSDGGWWFVLNAPNILTLEDGAFLIMGRENCNLRNGGRIEVQGRSDIDGPSLVVAKQFRIAENGSLPEAAHETSQLRMTGTGWMQVDPALDGSGKAFLIGTPDEPGTMPRGEIVIENDGRLELLPGDDPNNTLHLDFGNADPSVNQIIIRDKGELWLPGDAATIAVVGPNDVVASLEDLIAMGLIANDQGGTIEVSGANPTVVKAVLPGLGTRASYILTTSKAVAGADGSGFTSLDGTWSHDNGSDEWDGSAIGDGSPGGLSAIDGYFRIQETGDPRDHGFPDPGSNRKIYLGHDVGLDGASADVLDAGATLFFRARLATDGPLDQLHPDGGGDLADVPATGDGYLVHDSGKGNISIKQSSGGVISFCLSTAAENGIADGLMMNSLDGASVSGNVDSGEGTPNLIELDPTVWHDFWVTIQADGSGVGTHQVDVSVDGGVAQTFIVTAGSGDDFAGISYLAMGVGSTGQSGAYDLAALQFAPSVQPASLRIVDLPAAGTDAAIGIDASKTYTHALDFGTNPPAVINGVAFDQGPTENVREPYVGVTSQGYGYMLDDTRAAVRINAHGGNDVSDQADGGSAELLRDMVYFSGAVADEGIVLTLQDLAPGTEYSVRYYFRAWDPPLPRPITVINDSGESMDIDIDAGGAHYLDYTFVAEDGDVSLSFITNDDNQGVHLYGITCEVVE